ncbi:MAG: cell wall metabolism sensor histidine kinase VicK, partial [Lactococcus sp.]|nr:cell wall metabolism sensor histidine kinase VicK [Lactococcus sp.]
MKSKLPFTSSILFKAILLHLLLFVGFFALNTQAYIGQHDSFIRFCAFYILSLILIVWFTRRISIGLNQISDQIHEFTDKKYTVRKQIPGNTEINHLYDKVVDLGEKS